MPFEVSAAATSTFQGFILDPSAPLGFSLSQAVEHDAPSVPAPTSIPGPTTGVMTINVTEQPNCWTTAGVPFYGTLFSEINVSSDGTIQFGGTDTDTTPSVSDSLLDDGRVGFWTNLDPTEGGTVTVSSPATDVIIVDYAGVWYDAGGPPNTFSIEFDCATGAITITGLQGIGVNPGVATTDDQWIGISPGISVAPLTATDPGAAIFTVGGSATALADGDALYEFNDTSVSLSGQPACVLAGVDTLAFTPTPVGLATNYTWFGTN
jgi:hypothetical protein